MDARKCRCGRIAILTSISHMVYSYHCINGCGKTTDVGTGTISAEANPAEQDEVELNWPEHNIHIKKSETVTETMTRYDYDQKLAAAQREGANDMNRACYRIALESLGLNEARERIRQLYDQSPTDPPATEGATT